MKLRSAALTLYAAILLCGGCAVQGRPFEKAAAPRGNEIVYVYRPYHYSGSLLRPPVTCGDDTARIGPGGYHAFIVPAGQKSDCTVQWSESSDQIEIDGDSRVAYVREEIGWGMLSGHPHLDPVDSDTADLELQHCCVDESQPAQH